MWDFDAESGKGKITVALLLLDLFDCDLRFTLLRVRDRMEEGSVYT